MIFGEWNGEEFRKVMKREAFEDRHDAGLAEGVSIGIQQANRENARNLLRIGLGTFEQIAQEVSLSLDEVLALKEALSHAAVAQ